VRTLATSVALALAVVLASPAIAAAGTDPVPTRCDREQTEGSTPKRCVGPVTDESGGGGDTLTIVLSVVIGLTVAGVAFVLLRKQLTAPPRTTNRSDGDAP
jgi:hypothetical protein